MPSCFRAPVRALLLATSLLPAWAHAVTHTYQGFDPYLVLDARAAYRIDAHWSAAVGVDNLGARDYVLFHPFPQRSVLAELKYVY